MVKPPNARAGQALPAILVVYGGTVWGGAPPSHAKPTTQYPQFSGQLLAAQGYVVVYPSLPVELGATSDVMAALAQHSVAAIDALAAKGVIDPEPYIRNSPIFHVERMNAPLLMLHGDLDLSMTGLDGAQRMYNALVRAGKKPALVRYWGESHVADGEWAIRDQWSRITAWFAAHLGKPGS